MQWGRRLAGGAALVLALGGCATPSAQEDVVPTRYVEAPQLSESAKAAVGDVAARQAYDELVGFVLDQSMQGDLLDPQRTSFTPEEISTGVRDRMTPRAAAVWEDYVAQALAGDTSSEEVVHTLRLYGLTAPGLELPPGGSPVRSQAVSGGAVGVTQDPATGVPALKISFDHHTGLSYLDGKSPYPGTVDQELSFVVVRGSGASTDPAAVPTDGGATWFISQFEGETEIQFDRQGEVAPTVEPGEQPTDPET